MQEALKWTLRLRIEGLALWMNRGKYIDVLFPNDRLAGSGHHYVTYSGGGHTDRRLSGVTLDFTTLSTTGPLVIVDPLGWLEMPIEDESIAADGNSVFKVSDGLEAAIRLPLGTLSPMPEPLLAPFDFGKQTGLALGYGITWQGVVYGKPSIDVGWFEPATEWASMTNFGAFNAAGKVQEFRIRSLSDDDRRDQRDVQPGELLTETQFIGHLSRKGGQLLDDAPRYNPNGDGGGGPMLFVTPRKPCPSGFGSGFM